MSDTKSELTNGSIEIILKGSGYSYRVASVDDDYINDMIVIQYIEGHKVIETISFNKADIYKVFSAVHKVKECMNEIQNSD